jgi:hypothetical protein
LRQLGASWPPSLESDLDAFYLHSTCTQVLATTKLNPPRYQATKLALMSSR